MIPQQRGLGPLPVREAPSELEHPQPALLTISHEHNETVTDSLGDAWIDGSGNENGDLCISRYRRALGGSGAVAWSEAIDGGHYYLQEEWSNEDSFCRPRGEVAAISFSALARQGSQNRDVHRAGTPRTRMARSSPWTGSSATAGGCHRRVASHAFGRPGSYTVVLESTDSADNWAFLARDQGHDGSREGFGASRAPPA